MGEGTQEERIQVICEVRRLCSACFDVVDFLFVFLDVGSLIGGNMSPLYRTFAQRRDNQFMSVTILYWGLGWYDD